jgi:hypothetical protein
MARYINPMFVGPDKTKSLAKGARKGKAPLKVEYLGTFIKAKEGTFIPKTRASKKNKSR